MSNIIRCVQMDKQQAEFLRIKIPEFRKLKPGFLETDLFIDVLLEEYDEIWPLREFLWPGFDEEKDVPITYPMAVQLCRALAKRRVVCARARALHLLTHDDRKSSVSSCGKCDVSSSVSSKRQE